MKKMTYAENTVLSKFGAFVRRTAKGLIRKRKRSSNPGEPPSSHVGTLKEFIYFAYDTARRSVVIGPMKTNQVFFNSSGPVKGTVPEVLESGGTIRVFEVFKYGRWQRADLRSRRSVTGLPTRIRNVTIEARPYMGPAAKKELPKLPSMWANSLR